jgi:3-oxoadipate enol-lactonase
MIQKISIKDCQIAYREDGPANGPVIILSNSLMSNFSMWDSNINSLTDQYRVIRYDTRGHGQSEVTPGPYSIGMLAEDLVGLMDALSIDKAHLVGLSMGGMICQYVGANFSGRVLSLSLCDTASEMPPRSLWAERFAQCEKDGIAGLVEGTINRWFVADFIKKAPGEIAKVKEMILTTTPNGYINCASAVRDMAQTTMLLKITAPTLILVGRDDPACTVNQSIVLQRMITHAQMKIIDNAAHLSNIEKPEEFNQAIRQFIDSV